MKILSWNCCCKFREKYKFALEQNADIYVIQECENPDTVRDSEDKNLFKNGFWTGEIDYKGLGIFSTNPNIKLQKLNWSNSNRKYFIPVKANDINLVAVWACEPYCEMFYDYYKDVQKELGNNTILIGDFNSNRILDSQHKKEKSWEACIKLFNQNDYVDVYNDLTGEEEGREKTPTFFLHKHLDKPFHFDRCVAPKNKIKSFDVLTNYIWLTRSDHLPIIVSY